MIPWGCGLRSGVSETDDVKFGSLFTEFITVPWDRIGVLEGASDMTKGIFVYGFAFALRRRGG